MIKTSNCYIRTTDPDDAPALYALHDPEEPRAALLDNKREPLCPTRDELREMLGRKEAAHGAFYAIEDFTGTIMGFCGLRGQSTEATFAELNLILREESYASHAADDAMEFLKNRAFVRAHLKKVLVVCLETEKALRACLLRHGFESDGVQREVFFTSGRYLSLETLSCKPAGESANPEIGVLGDIDAD